MMRPLWTWIGRIGISIGLEGVLYGMSDNLWLSLGLVALGWALAALLREPQSLRGTEQEPPKDEPAHYRVDKAELSAAVAARITQLRQAGWTFVYCRDTRFVSADHPRGGGFSVCEISQSSCVGDDYHLLGEFIAAALNTAVMSETRGHLLAPSEAARAFGSVRGLGKDHAFRPLPATAREGLPTDQMPVPNPSAVAVRQPAC